MARLDQARQRGPLSGALTLFAASKPALSYADHHTGSASRSPCSDHAPRSLRRLMSGTSRTSSQRCHQAHDEALRIFERHRGLILDQPKRQRPEYGSIQTPPAPSDGGYPSTGRGFCHDANGERRDRGAVTLAWWGFLAWLVWHVIYGQASALTNERGSCSLRRQSTVRRNPHTPFAAVMIVVTIGVVPRGLKIKMTKRRAAVAWRLEVFWEVSKSKEDGWMTPH